MWRRNLPQLKKLTFTQKLNCYSTALEKKAEFKDILPTSHREGELSSHFARPVLPLLEKPIVKSFFIGEINSKAWPFPELDEESEVDRLNTIYEHAAKVIKTIDDSSIEHNGNIPEKTLQILGQMGLFGMSMPMDYGGMGLSAMETMRVLEACGTCPALGQIFFAHEHLASKAILLGGNEGLKEHYLPSLASGRAFAALGLHEEKSGMDHENIQTTATLSDDGNFYYLNGVKSWVTNAQLADLFVIVARNNDNFLNSEPRHTALIVERSTPGLRVGEPTSAMGNYGANICDVHLRDCIVPIQNVIDEPGRGFQLIMRVFARERYALGGLCVGVMRQLINDVVTLTNENQRFGRCLSDFNLVQKHIAEMSTDLFVLESMTFFTAGLLDSYDTPDISVEAACLQLFATEALTKAINICMQIVGPESLKAGSTWERRFRQYRSLLMCQDSPIMLKLFIGQACIEYYGQKMLQKIQMPFIKKLKELRKALGHLIVYRKNEELFVIHEMEIKRQIHMTLLDSGAILGTRVNRMPKNVYLFVNDDKENHKSNQESVIRFADIAMHLYGLMCGLSRASRTLAIGVRHADFEAQLINRFAFETRLRVDNHLEIITNFDLLQKHRRFLNESICVDKNYVIQNPLARFTDKPEAH